MLNVGEAGRVGIVGLRTGGTDVMPKTLRSPLLRCGMLARLCAEGSPVPMSRRFSCSARRDRLLRTGAEGLRQSTRVEGSGVQGTPLAAVFGSLSAAAIEIADALEQADQISQTG